MTLRWLFREFTWPASHDKHRICNLCLGRTSGPREADMLTKSVGQCLQRRVVLGGIWGLALFVGCVRGALPILRDRVGLSKTRKARVRHCTLSPEVPRFGSRLMLSCFRVARSNEGSPRA